MRKVWIPILLLLCIVDCRSKQENEMPWDVHQVWVGGQRDLGLNPSLIEIPATKRSKTNSPDSRLIPLRGDVMWVGDRAWYFSTSPAHPAVDLIKARCQETHAGLFGIGTYEVSHFDPVWGSIPRMIYCKMPGASWKEMGQYRPSEDTHGFARILRPLGDGSFLAIDNDWFKNENQVSPCARYTLDSSGELRFQRLLNVLDPVPLPQCKPAPFDAPEGAPRSPWLDWYDEVDYAIGSQVVAIISSFGGCLSLLDPIDGHFLHHVRLPQLSEGQRYFSLRVQTAPDGSFHITAAKSLDQTETPRTPGGELAAAHLGLINEDLEVQPIAFHLDPVSGELEEEALPAGVPRILSHAEFNFSFVFLVDAAGHLELHRRTMR